jgi:hypothetical protein
MASFVDDIRKKPPQFPGGSKIYTEHKHKLQVSGERKTKGPGETQHFDFFEVYGWRDICVGIPAWLAPAPSPFQTFRFRKS